MNGRLVDVNADVGEGLDDEALMPFLTSVSIACGGHAGDGDSMAATLRAARDHGLRAGAHPGYPDRAGFGRVEMDIPPVDLLVALQDQMAALTEVAAENGVRLTHVKAHGALYNRAWTDAATAAVIADAVLGVDPRLAIFCPAGSEQAKAALGRGLTVIHEVFLDRAYGADGRLRPRSQPGALVDSTVALAQQVSNIAGLQFETMCVHGDNPAALDLLRAARELFSARGWQLTPYTVTD